MAAVAAGQGSRRTRWAVTGTAAILVAAAGGWVVSGAAHGAPAAAGSGPVSTGTAAVVRTSLSTTTEVAGTLGYSGSYQVINQLAGTLTALPRLGAVLRRGQSLYEVDGTAVPLLYGTRPMWRTIQAGITAGPDVRQLDENLIALGYTDGGYLIVSETFSWAAAAAISAWQAATGQPVTGAIQLGQVVFEPGPVRVDSLAAAIGAPVQPGTAILSATSDLRSVDVQLPVAQEYLVRQGDTVTVTLPDGTTTTPGVIAAIAPVATTANSGSNGAAPASSGSQAGGSQGGTGGTASDTVDMTVRLTRPGAAGRYDQAPVQVNIVDARADGVLAAPINALVALAGGGYGLEVVHGTRRTLIAVRTGLFASTLVQVSGTGLRAGLQVQVPQS